MVSGIFQLLKLSLAILPYVFITAWAFYTIILLRSNQTLNRELITAGKHIAIQREVIDASKRNKQCANDAYIKLTEKTKNASDASNDIEDDKMLSILNCEYSNFESDENVCS